VPTYRHTGATGLVRPRLLMELTPLRQSPLALIVAPAGFGKTTLLAHYAHAFDGAVVWITADPGDTDPSTLNRRLRRACPVSLPVPHRPHDLVEFAEDLGAGLRQDTLLVIDDAQWLEGSDGERAVERMLVAAPPHLHTVLAGRRMPGVNTARHELTGLLTIGPDKMRFRAWEAEELLRDVYREPLPPSDIAALSRRVGGWPAGLHLFHLSTRGRPLTERRAAVAALDGRASLCRAYLARTVLGDLPGHLHSFLIRTGVFDTLTGPRCDELLGQRDSHLILAELERLQAFTTSSDGGWTYRYHEVLRSHLAATLVDDLGDDGARQWHVRAAQILEREDAYAEAARSYARAGRWSSVRRLLGRLGASLIVDGVEPWRDVLPAWLVAEDPWLMLAEGRHRFSRGQIVAAIESFRHAHGLFTDADGRAHCQQALARANVWLSGPRRAQGAWPNWLRAATQGHPAMVAGRADELPGADGRLVRAVARTLAGDLLGARRELAGPDADVPGVLGMALRLLHGVAQVATGSPAGPATLAQVALEAEHEAPWLARMARAAVAVDGTEQGAKAARAIAEECAREGDAWGEVIAGGLAWLPHAGTADPAELAELVRRCRRLDAAVLLAWVQALHALAAAGADLPDAELLAGQAAAMARSAGVPGARAIALAAAAGVPGCPPGSAARARAFAAECGLPDALTTAWLDAAEPPYPEAGAPAPITVRCLGGFSVERAGLPVDPSTVKPRVRSLLRLLAMNAGAAVHRGALVEALWPDLSPVTAAHNLHVAVSSLRKLLEPESPRGHARLLVREGDGYRLALPPPSSCDVTEVRAALDDARRRQLGGDRPGAVRALRAAVGGYGGDLLPQDGTEEWVVRERDVLRTAVAIAAAQLAAYELDDGAAVAATVAAERCLAIDRYHDEGWRVLIAAYERNGDRGAAQRARGRYAEVLAELGIAPQAAH
jgi:DNA-binding SARP family transcriptional activator